MKNIILALAGLVAIALVIFFIMRQPEAQSEIKKTKQDTKELGNDAVDGVKDAYGATKDAVQDAVK